MNREQRRRFNKKNKTNYTKEQFETYIAMERLKRGIFDLSDLQLPKDFVHMDNKELAPDGTEVKLHFDSLNERCKTVDSSNEYFRNWIAKAKEEPDKIYHITREGAHSSLVCLVEDENYVELDGKQVKAPKLLFDLMSDLEMQVGDKWVQIGLIDEDSFRKYTEVKIANKQG